MKKILTLCAGLLLVFGLSACDETGELPGPGEEPEPEVTEPGPVDEPDDNEPDGDTEPQYIELTLGKYEYELEVSSEEELVVSTNTPASITFSSTDDTIAFAGEKDGSYYIYSGLVAGDAIITVTATADGWEKDSKDVKVTVTETPDTDPVVTGISFDGTSYEIQVGGESIDFASHVTVSGTNNPTQEFTLTSSDTTNEYITITDKVVTAVKATEEDTPVTLTATREDHGNSWTATATLTVLEEVIEPKVESITFSQDSYEVTYTQGETGTLDLSNAVTVSGTETLEDKTFTISCEADGYESYFTIENNVITAHAPTTSDGIEIKATSHFDSEKVATAKVVVTDGTKYVEKIEFSGIDNEEVTLYTGNIDDDHPNTREVTAKVTPDDAYETDYEIAVADIGIAEWVDGTLQAKSAGETTITATSKGLTAYDGTAATVAATVIVEYVTTPVSTIGFSPSTLSVRESDTFTIGDKDSGADVEVVNITEGADDKTWGLSKTAGEDYINISDPVEGVYTVSPKAESAGNTAKIRVTPTDPASEDVYAELTVTILADDYGVIYVESLVLSETDKTVTEGETESFTIGADGSDVTVTVDPSNATNPAYTVTCNSDSDKVTVTGSGTSWTVNILKGAGGESEEGTEYEIVIASEDGNTSSTLKLTVNRPESVPTDWEVTTTGDLKIENVPKAAAGEQPATLDLDEVVTITIKDQYGETMTDGDLGGYTVTANTNNITVTDHVVSAASYVDATASVTLTSSDIENKTATLSITLVAKEYPVESITVNGSDSVTESVEWGGSTSVTVSVTPSYADDTGYSVVSDLASDAQLFEVKEEDNTVTFTHKGVHAGTEVFTITPDDGTDISCTVTLTAEPEIIEPGTPYFENLAGTYEHTATIADLESYLNYNWDTEDADHVHDSVTTEFTSSDTGVITIEGSTATIVGTGSTTITATISAEHLESDLTATADITIIWTATELKISDETLTLEEGQTGSLSVSFGPSGYTTTPTVTWEVTEGSGYVSLSANTGDSITVTAVSAGSAVITASADGCTPVTCTVTVTATPKFESYTLTVSLKQSDGSTAFPSPHVTDELTYHLYINSAYDNWGTHELEYDSVSDTYSYTYTTLPSNGTYESNIYACASSPIDWEADEWIYWFEWSVAGTETGALTKSVTASHTGYDSWDDVFPELGEEENFYIVFWDNSGLSSLTGTYVINSGTNCFNGTTQSSATQTKTKDSKLAWYSVAGELAENEKDWFTMADSSNTKWMQAGEQEIPSNKEGTPVYCAGGWFSGWSGTWNADQTGSGWQYMSSGTTIADFVANLTFNSNN